MGPLFLLLLEKDRDAAAASCDRNGAAELHALRECAYAR